MFANSLIYLRRWIPIVFLGALLLGAPTATAQLLDRNGNGVSDLWELFYGTDGFDLDFDSDEDGVPNRLEAVAGTDPCDARSRPRIIDFRMTPAGFQVTMAGARGKRFELQSCEVLEGRPSTHWTTESSLVARTGAEATFLVPVDGSSRIFRMMLSDVDTDGDGLNDWEEYQLELDPLSATSNGQVDSAGKRLSDYQYLTGRLALQTLASLMANSLKTQPRRVEPVCGIAVNANFPIVAASLPSGSGLTAQYFTNASSTYTNPVNFHPTNLFLTTNDPGIDYTWGPALFPNLSNGFYTVRWTGQVEPQYSETYYFQTRTDDGVKLWVNDQLLIDRWQIQGTTTWTNALTLQAGVRYNLRMDYFNRGGSARAQLSWFSPSQPRQVVPSLRLYPSSDGFAPGAVTSPLTAVGFLGQPFGYAITGANSPFGYGASNLPTGLTLNSTNGIISGIPTLAGGFDIGLFVTNSVGTAEAVLHLDVFDTGSAVTREVWLGVPGSSVKDIPLHLPASSTNSLGTLEGVTNFGDNYAERIRGYLVAPVTGNYYFWIAANAAAELWISNDGEPANKVRRAFVAKSTLSRQWTLQPNQRSGWLALEAGKRYYLEILHKAGIGANDHWSVGWLQDPTGTSTTPPNVIPGYVLAPFTNTPPAQIPGVLYSANMVAQSGAVSPGVGSATLRLSADESQAVLRFSSSGLSAPVTAKHIHADTYLGKNSQGQIVFDIDAATPELDGSYVWQITPSGPLSTADLVEIIKQGKSYLNIHTVTYPAGEINGHFTLADGTATFTPPPPALVWTNDHSSSNAVARFLSQATFGPSPAEIKSVRSLGYERWIDKQFRLRISGHLTNV